MAKYGQDIDRDSAHEMLARKLQAGAEEAERERQAEQAEEEAKRRAKAEAEAPRASASAPSGPTAPRTRSSPARGSRWWRRSPGRASSGDFARTAGREIVRSIFGTARRRR